MATRTLPREEWAGYFGALAPEEGRPGRADYVVLRLELPGGIGVPEPRRLPFEGFAFDPRDDLFELVAPGLRHFVLHPESVRVDEVEGRLCRLAFDFRNGVREVLELQ